MVKNIIVFLPLHFLKFLICRSYFKIFVLISTSPFLTCVLRTPFHPNINFSFTLCADILIVLFLHLHFYIFLSIELKIMYVI